TVAGSAGLVRQYYMDGWYPTGSKTPANGFTPSAALIKATIINSAREMTGAGAYANGENKYPNDNQGYGRVALDDALFFQGDARGTTVDDHRSGINTGDTVTYQLAIGDSSIPVEATLVWTDYPGTANCGPCLVNDLDLTVTAPDGTTYNGNQYMGFNPGESQPNPTSRDNLNNVESVLVISNVQAGLWTVTVHGFNVPQGAQSFALVLTGGIATEPSKFRTATTSLRCISTITTGSEAAAPCTRTRSSTIRRRSFRAPRRRTYGSIGRTSDGPRTNCRIRSSLGASARRPGIRPD